MSHPGKQVNETCSHIDLENYTCDYLDEPMLAVNPICRECLSGLYMLWKESIWAEAKRRNGRLFPHFGTHGRGEEAPQ